MTRPDVHSAAITLAALPDGDAQIVVREADAGSEESLRAALEAQVRVEQLGHSSSAIAAPEPVQAAGLSDTWGPAVCSCLRRPESERTLEVILPAFAREVDADAEAAGAQEALPRDARAQADSEVHRIEIQRDYEMGKVSSGQDLLGRARKWRRLSIGLFVVEAAGIYVAVGAAFGLMDGMPLSTVSGPMWVQVMGIGTLASVALFAATFLAAERVIVLKLGVRFQTAAAVVATVVAVLMAVSLGVIRWWGMQSAYQVSDDAVDWGSMALLVVVSLASSCLALASATARLNATQAEKEAEAISKVERRYAAEVAGPTARRAAAEADLNRLNKIIHRPLSLRTAFERAVKQAEEEARAQEAEFANRLEQAFGAFRLLRALPPELRCLVSSEVFVLRSREEGAGQEPPRVAGRRGRFARSAAVPSTLAMILMGLISGCGSGAAGDPDLVMACDGTGSSPEDVCTNDLLERRFVDWAQTAAFRPGATFTVILSAGSYGDTVPAERIVVPQRWASRPERPRWMAEQVGKLAAISIPTSPDLVPGARTQNLSDLVSLVSVSSREARGSRGPVELLLASDGWLVSLGVDTESCCVPEPAAFLERLRASDVPWDLSVFTHTQICGLHNRGAVAGKVAARDRLLLELFKAGNTSTPDLFTSCRDLYPAVPAELRPKDVVSMDSNAGDLQVSQ